jgi:hypothetical protein
MSAVKKAKNRQTWEAFMPLIEENDRYKLYFMKKDKDWEIMKIKYESDYRGGGVFSNICTLANRNGCKTVLIEKAFMVVFLFHTLTFV